MGELRKSISMGNTSGGCLFGAVVDNNPSEHIGSSPPTPRPCTEFLVAELTPVLTQRYDYTLILKIAF